MTSKRNWLIALIGGVMALSAEAAHGKECAGVSFPDQAQVNGNTLTLNGLGLRSSDPSGTLGSNAPKQLVLHFVRNVGSADLRKAWDEGFASNAKDQLPALKERIETVELPLPSALARAPRAVTNRVTRQSHSNATGMP